MPGASKVRVYQDGELVRVEHANGKTHQYKDGSYWYQVKPDGKAQCIGTKPRVSW